MGYKFYFSYFDRSWVYQADFPKKTSETSKFFNFALRFSIKLISNKLKFNGSTHFFKILLYFSFGHCIPSKFAMSKLFRFFFPFLIRFFVQRSRFPRSKLKRMSFSSIYHKRSHFCWFLKCFRVLSKRDCWLSSWYFRLEQLMSIAIFNLHWNKQKPFWFTNKSVDLYS